MAWVTQLPEPGRRRQPYGDPGLALGCQPHPLEAPSVVLSCRFESLASLLGDCLLPLRPTDVHSWRSAVKGVQLCPSGACATGDGNLSSGPGRPLSLVVWPWAGPWPPWASVSSLSNGGGSSFFPQMLTEDLRCVLLCAGPQARARPSGPCLQGVYAPWGADIEHL